MKLGQTLFAGASLAFISACGSPASDDAGNDLPSQSSTSQPEQDKELLAIASMNMAEINLAETRANCITPPGEALQPYERKRELDEARYERKSELGETAYYQMGKDFTAFYKILAADPDISDSGVSAQDVALAAATMKIGFYSEYPMATCGPAYFMSPFDSAKRMDLGSIQDMLAGEDMPADLLEEFGIDPEFLKAQIANITPEQIDEIKDYVVAVESDDVATIEEALGLIQRQAALAAFDLKTVENPAMISVARTVLEDLDVPTSDDNIRAMAYQIARTATVLPMMREMEKEFGQAINPNHGPMHKEPDPEFPELLGHK